MTIVSSLYTQEDNGPILAALPLDHFSAKNLYPICNYRYTCTKKLCSPLEMYVSYVCSVYILSVINCIFDCLSLKVTKLTTFSHIRRIAYSIQRYMEHTLS